MHSEGSPEQAGCTPPALSLLGGTALPRPAGGLQRACDQWAPCSEEPCAWVGECSAVAILKCLIF